MNENERHHQDGNDEDADDERLGANELQEFRFGDRQNAPHHATSPAAQVFVGRFAMRTKMS